MIVLDDISSNLALSNILEVEPNQVYKDILDHLNYWIPSPFVIDKKVLINGESSYYYVVEISFHIKYTLICCFK
jgi:hypothetical protein